LLPDARRKGADRFAVKVLWIGKLLARFRLELDFAFINRQFPYLLGGL